LRICTFYMKKRKRGGDGSEIFLVSQAMHALICNDVII
jgi:hypothetical protein